MLGEAQNTAIFNYGYYLEGTARTEKAPHVYRIHLINTLTQQDNAKQGQVGTNLMPHIPYKLSYTKNKMSSIMHKPLTQN